MRAASLTAIALLVNAAAAYRVVGGARIAARRACGVTMFDESAAVGPTSITRSQESRLGSSKTGGRIVVTDGSGTFYSSRTMIQTLHDFGTFGQITAFGDSIVESKKSLMTRQSRYSGLNDILSFEEGDLTSAMAGGASEDGGVFREGASAWLAINADEATLPEQIACAKSAGVTRVFILLSAGGPTAALADLPSFESLLSGMDYTVMRTGSLVDSEAAADGLKLDDVDMPVCEDVAREDVFRFVTEALTLGEAYSRTFSLCPSPGPSGTAGALKQMRYAGYERRDEVQSLLSGLIAEQKAAAEPTADEAKEQEEAVMRSSAEVAAEREKELQMLLERARKRGEETQARLQFEALEKEAHRKEQEKYYKAPSADGEGGDGGEEPPVDGDADTPTPTP